MARLQKISASIGAGILLLIPSITFAAPGTFKDFILQITGLVSLAVQLVGALALLVFFWGIARFILSASGSQKRTEDKMFLFWSVIILFMMSAVWGLVEILKATLLNS